MENVKNFNNLKHLGPQNHCKALFQNSAETGGFAVNSNAPKQDPVTSSEIFSRKVFVGGLPPDIDAGSIAMSFSHFGPLSVDWPHKSQSHSPFPPKGYAFLIFENGISVNNLLMNCFLDDGKYYIPITSPSIVNKLVQIRPWCLKDADYVLDPSIVIDPRLTVFVGGVPRPLRAVELAEVMQEKYQGVCYSGIDTDQELKYPKGAGRVTFSDRQSYIAAISNRFIQLQLEDIDKRIEIKPFVMCGQICDECCGTRSNGQLASYFCAHFDCLRYFCNVCWPAVHSQPGYCFHKPLVKEGNLRPRTVPFRSR